VGRSRTFLRFLTSKSAPRSAPLGLSRTILLRSNLVTLWRV
jgi:hypothetical protein